jgi:hypothetical protein
MSFKQCTKPDKILRISNYVLPPQHPDFVMQSFSGTGLVVLLNWMTHPGMQQHHEHKLLPPSPSYCDFNRERGKVRCEYTVKKGYHVSRPQLRCH